MKTRVTLPRLALLALTAVLVAACGGGGEPAAEEAEGASRETVFDPLVDTLDRSRGVQQTIDERAAEQRRRLDEAEQ